MSFIIAFIVIIGIIIFCVGLFSADSVDISTKTPFHRDVPFIPGRYANEKKARPKGWVSTTSSLEVYGLKYRYDNVDAFVEEVINSEREKRNDYGIRLRPEPENKSDKNAIAVYGNVGEQEWFIGYIDRKTAKELNEDLISKNIPILGELSSIVVGKTGYIKIVIFALAPSGNGLHSRTKGRGDRA